MNRICLIPLLLALPGASPGAGAQETAQAQAELIFQSGFEGTCEVVPGRGSDNDIVGRDTTLAEKSDWVEDLEKRLGCSVNLQYTGGNPSQRFAKIVPEPGNPGNRVLHFRLNDSWVADGNHVKARVQANIYGLKEGLKEFYQSVRIFLPEEWTALRRYPRRIGWLTISEFWNNAMWGNDPYGFRVTLGIGKPTGEESDLFFILDAQDPGFKQVWKADNDQVKVPIGQWFTMEYYYKEGDSKNGRFYLAMTPEGKPRQVVFDVTGFTHNTKDPAPDGVTHYNPLKLYTSKELVAYVKAQGRSLQIYWDDFRLWKGKRP